MPECSKAITIFGKNRLRAYDDYNLFLVLYQDEMKDIVTERITSRDCKIIDEKKFVQIQPLFLMLN